MDKTKIEWADATWNPIAAFDKPTGQRGWFCEHVSEGCRNCYAETLNKRLGTQIEYKAQNRNRVFIELMEGKGQSSIDWPLRTKKPRRHCCEKASRPSTGNWMQANWRPTPPWQASY